MKHFEGVLLVSPTFFTLKGRGGGILTHNGGTNIALKRSSLKLTEGAGFSRGRRAASEIAVDYKSLMADLG